MSAIEQLKQLREETGLSVSECKKALDEAGGSIEKAKDILKEWGKTVARKKQERGVGAGLVVSYVHGTGKAGALIELRCETDFVARSDDFKNLGHELALQIVSMAPENTEELLSQPYIRDTSLTARDLIQSVIAKLGENIKVERFSRFEI
ncbi:MAG: translation elongation factor Ts [Candidatus Wildermuthbacteria bacterium]|nr:translation elongation factor Ts [Candidatus Wildermuthbacteria bacterium]